jgi:hypothetical protein
MNAAVALTDSTEAPQPYSPSKLPYLQGCGLLD